MDKRDTKHRRDNGSLTPKDDSKESLATIVMFRIICFVMAVAVVAGSLYLFFCENPSHLVYWAVMGVGFLLNILIASYYLSEKKNRGYFFVLLALVLGIMILNKVLQLI